jgi:hypothetical protein
MLFDYALTLRTDQDKIFSLIMEIEDNLAEIKERLKK